MEEKFFFIPKYLDCVFNFVLPSYLKEIGDGPLGAPIKEFKIDNYTYYIFQNTKIYILIGLDGNGEQLNNAFIWGEKNLKILDTYLRNFFPNDKIIVAIHWGGEGYQAQTKKYVDLNNKLKDGEISLTYYSEHHDKITMIDDLIRLVPNIKERVESKTNLKKTLINLWLPLAIDIQGLSEVQNETHKADEYFNEIKMETDYLNLLKSFPNEDFPNWEEIKNELGNGYKEFNPVKLVDEMINKSFTDFDKKYFSDPSFLPNWLQEVVRVIDEKLKQNK